MAKVISLKQLKTEWTLYLYVLPSALLVAVFSYYPCASAIYHSFFRWNGDSIEEFVGLRNFHQILGWSPTLWFVFAAWVCLMMMILTGKPDGFRHKAPFCLVGLVWVVGFLILSGANTGADTQVLYLQAREAAGWYGVPLTLTTIGILCYYFFENGWTSLIRGTLVISGFLSFFYYSMVATGDSILWKGFAVTFILVMANVIKMIPSIATAVMIHRLVNEKMQYFYRVLFVVPMIIPAMVYLLIWKYFFEPSNGVLNRILKASGGMDLLVMADKTLGFGGVFQAGVDPSWLGDVNLIIPSLILWGFPWVGVVGVLIYLAGLSSIGTELYEAADVDGIGWFRKFIYIELPLIMTQVRINMIMMVIGTLQGYAFILILLGDTGGPQGVALVPGLHMFRNAFIEGYAGYACAIGLVLFFFILILTEINNRYVKVDK